jgi:uncharacterized Zn finger protein (UPF0148 family)
VFTCRRCGTGNAIALPPDGAAEITCPACGSRQPRRDYEVERVALQFHEALERASVEVEASKPDDEELVLCPSCGSVLFTGEEGCPRCGYGRKKFLARHAALVPWVLFFLVVLGVAAAAALMR